MFQVPRQSTRSLRKEARLEEPAVSPAEGEAAMLRHEATQTCFSVRIRKLNGNIVQYTNKGGKYDGRANSRGYGEGLASESVQRTIAEIIDSRRAGSSIRRVGVEVG